MRPSSYRHLRLQGAQSFVLLAHFRGKPWWLHFVLQPQQLCVVVRQPSSAASRKFDVLRDSEVLVLELAGLQQTADLGHALALLILRLLSSLLAILLEELGVVARKLLELDEEIAED